MSYSSLSQTITVIYITVMLTYVNSNNPLPHLLSTLLNDEQLKSCELISVSIRNNKIRDDIRDLTPELLHPSLLPNYDVFTSSSGIFTIVQTNNPNNKTFQDISYHRLQDIHKLNSKHCGVAILQISQITSDLPRFLFQTIIPRYVPIIRKDLDHFLFVFNTEVDANELLLSPDFGVKIKFKVGFLPPQSKLKQPMIKIKHIDLYGENGECVINTITNLPLTGIKSLFIDPTNFKGKRLRVVNPKAPSYFEMISTPNGKSNRPIRGLYKVWLDVMMDRFNFTIQLSLSSASGSTGKRLKNGTWVGSIGDILSGRADMASFNGHIYNRHEYVDWSAPLTYEWMVFIIHKPKSYFSASAIYRPFPVILWIGFIGTVIVLGFVLKVTSKFPPGIGVSPLKFCNVIMFVVASFMEQGGLRYLTVVHSHSIRVAIGFWFVFGLTISTAYRGKLVSLIAFPALTWVPTTFDELAYSDYRVGLNVFGKGGATYSVLSTSKSPVYEEFFKRMELYPDPVKCLRTAYHYNFGCLMVKSVADFFEAKNFTDRFGRSPFQSSDQTALFREDGYIWEKRAIFRKHFDRVTWSMMETGLSNLWFHKDLDMVKKKRLDWERLNPGENLKLKLDAGDDGPTKLQVAHLIGLYYLFACGQGIGLVFVVWEIIKFRRLSIRRRLNCCKNVSKVEILNT